MKIVIRGSALVAAALQASTAFHSREVARDGLVARQADFPPACVASCSGMLDYLAPLESLCPVSTLNNPSYACIQALTAVCDPVFFNSADSCGTCMTANGLGSDVPELMSSVSELHDACVSGGLLGTNAPTPTNVGSGGAATATLGTKPSVTGSGNLPDIPGAPPLNGAVPNSNVSPVPNSVPNAQVPSGQVPNGQVPNGGSPAPPRPVQGGGAGMTLPGVVVGVAGGLVALAF